MMCCSSCSKWQHIPCHDDADQRAGRPQRNWETEDFVCRRCYAQKAQSLTTRPSTLQAISQVGLPLQPHYIYQNQATMPSVIPRTSGGHTSPQPRSTYANFTPQPSTSYSRNAITFAHYQPQQRGFSSQTHQVQPFVIQSHPPSQQLSLPTMNNGATPLSVQVGFCGYFGSHMLMRVCFSVRICILLWIRGGPPRPQPPHTRPMSLV